MTQSEQALALAEMVQELSHRARLAAAFMREPAHRQRLLRIADELDEEVIRLKALALVPLQAQPAVVPARRLP